MTDILDEVAEDVKEEKHHYITKKIIKFFVVAAAIAVVSASVYVWKERSVKTLQYNLGALFNQALTDIESDNLDKAITELNKIIEYPHQQYAALAYLNKAAILLKQGKIEESQRSLIEMSKQEHFDKLFRDLSKIIYLGNQLNTEKQELELTEEMLKAVCKDGNAWQLSGLQLKALYDIKNKNLDDAKISLNKIIDSKTTNKSSRDTANNILNVISRNE